MQTVEARPRIPGSEVPAYTLADGVDDAMRMSPDYLIVGEVRDGRAGGAVTMSIQALALLGFDAFLTGQWDSLTEMAEESMIEQEAAAGAEGVPEEGEE